MEKQDYIIDSSTELPAYEPENQDVITSKVDINDAFYGAALMGAEDPLQSYLDLVEEMQSTGDSYVLQALRNQYREFGNQEQALFVESLVADESISTADKRAILNKQLKFNRPENRSLRSQYLDSLVTAELAEMPEFSDSLENSKKFKIHGYKTKEDFNKMMNQVSGILQGTEALPQLTDQEQEEASSLLANIGENIIDPILAEPAALFQAVVVGLVPYLSELIGTGYIAATDGVDTNITKAREQAREYVNKEGGEWLVETYQDFLGFFGIEKEDLEEAYVTKAFTKLDEGLQWAAEKINPDDPEAAKIPLEILSGLAIPALAKVSPFNKKRFLKTQDPLSYEVKQALETRFSKKDLDPFANDNKIRTMEDLGINVPKDSPLLGTIVANKNATKALAETYMTDIGNTAVKATKFEIRDFIAMFMMPGIVRKPKFNETFDATPQFKQLKLVQEDLATDYVLNPFLSDSGARKVWLSENVNVVKESLLDNQLEMSPAQSTFIPDGMTIDSKLVFNKDGFNFDSYFEANEAGLMLNEKVQKIKSTKDAGEVVIEALDVEGDVVGSFKLLESDGPSPFLNQAAAQSSSNFRVVWKRKGEFFDEVKQLSGDFNQRPWANSKAMTAIFDNPKAWNWIAAFGRSGKAFESRWTQSHQRAEQIARRQLDILGDSLKLNNKKFREDLHTLYLESRNKSDLFTIDEIYKILDYNPKIEHVRDLQSSLALTRQIDRFNYKVLNISEINKAVEQGFADYLDIRRGPDSLHRSMVKQDFTFSPTRPVTKIYDPATQTSVDFVAHQANQLNVPGKQYLYVNDKPTRQIVELKSSFKDANGDVYNYVLVPETTKFSGAPNWIVPTRTGHLPRISLGNFFLKPFPEFVTQNGIRRAGTMQDGKTVAMFSTRTDAKKWYDANKDKVPELKDTDFDTIIKKADELESLDDNLETNIVREAVARPAKSSNENMYNTIYADPLESFIMTSQRLGTDAMMQPVIQQMQTQWLETYKNKVKLESVKDGEIVYPTQRKDIKIKDNKDADHRQALAEWDRMDVMQAGHNGQALSGMLAKLGDIIGDATDSPMFNVVSKAARKFERNPSILAGYPLRVVTTFKITLAAIWRNLTLQPIGIFGPILVGPNSKAALLNTAATVHARLNQNRTFGKYNRYNSELFKYAYEQGNITKNVDGVSNKAMLSELDHQLIVKHMNDSGLGVIGDHVLTKGLFSNSVQTLKGQSSFARYTGQAIKGYGKIGFELGEYMNRVGMFHAARMRWLEANPGKNWRSRKALDEITFDAYQLSGSMNKQNTYAFQRTPILQYIGQFQAFGMKASESLWNKGASPYSAKQRAYLAAYNLAVFGVRGGVIYGLGELLMDFLEASGAGEIADQIDDLAATRLIINNLADAINPTYDEEGNLIESTADIAAVYGPFGTEAGGVYRSFWKSLVVLFGGDVPNYQLGPTTQTIVQGIDTYQLISAMFKDDKAPLDEKLGKSLIQLARLSSGGNSLWNTYMYTQMNEKISKTGQTTGVPESNFDRYAKLFSVPNDKDRQIFEAWRGLTDEEKKYKEMAEVWFKSQLILNGTDMNFGELNEAFRAANNLMELTENQKDIFWEHIITLDNRRNNNRMGSFLQDVLNRRRIDANPKYSPEEIRSMQTIVKQLPNNDMNKGTLEAIIQQLEEMKEN